MARPTLRASRTGGSRVTRSVLLGTLVLLALLYWLAKESDIAAEDLAQYAVSSLIVIVLLVAAAALAVALWLGLRKLLGGGRRDEQTKL